LEQTREKIHPKFTQNFLRPKITQSLQGGGLPF